MLNDLARKIYAFNVTMGWHKDPTPNLAHFLMNLHAEVSELWEAWRNHKLGEPCDKAAKMVEHGIEPLTCIEEEIADILIRTLDTAHAFNVDLDRVVAAKMAYNATRGHRYGGKAA